MEGTLWDFLNSGIFALIFGATGGALLNYFKAKQSHRFELKFKFMERISNAFHKYTGLLYRGDLEDENFNTIHSEFGASIDVVRAVFSEKVAKEWERINGHLLQAKKLIGEGNQKEAREEMGEAFSIKFGLMKLMTEELD